MTKRQQTSYIAVHCTATKPSQDVGFKEIDAMHRNRGFDSCGYHFIIKRDGSIDLGRPLDDVGAHIKGFNSVSVGVALAGGISEDGKPENNFTLEQFTTLEQTLTVLNKIYPKAIIKGHRDFSPDLDGDGVIEPHEWLKECPCFDAMKFAKEIGL